MLFLAAYNGNTSGDFPRANRIRTMFSLLHSRLEKPLSPKKAACATTSFISQENYDWSGCGLAGMT